MLQTANYDAIEKDMLEWAAAAHREGLVADFAAVAQDIRQTVADSKYAAIEKSMTEWADAARRAVVVPVIDEMEARAMKVVEAMAEWEAAETPADIAKTLGNMLRAGNDLKPAAAAAFFTVRGVREGFNTAVQSIRQVVSVSRATPTAPAL